jgi:hypothetical protein
MRFVPHQAVSGGKIANAAGAKHPVNLGKHQLRVRYMFVDVGTDNYIEACVIEGQVQRVRDLEFQVVFDEILLGMLYGIVIYVDANYPSRVVGEEIIYGASRPANVEYVTIGKRLLQKVVENAEHGACLAFAVTRVVDIWTVLGKIVLVTSAQNRCPGQVLLL